MTARASMRLPQQRIEVGPLNDTLQSLGVEGDALVVGSERSVALVDGSVVRGRIHRFVGSRSHNPEEVVAEARAVAREVQPPWVIGVGSSSAIDLAKAVNADLSAQIVAVPTTLGGSEMTRFFGSRAPDGSKGGGSGGNLLPRTVIYDAHLLDTLPTNWLAASGMNALAHAIEAHYSRTEHWLGDAAAATVGNTLPALLLRSSGERTEDLHDELLGQACLAGLATNSSGMGLHHSICHVLGGLTGIPHAYLNAAVLPAAVATNLRLAPERVKRSLDLLGLDDLQTLAGEIRQAHGLESSLERLGATVEDLDAALPLVMSSHHMRNNPAALTEVDVSDCLRLAYTGS